MAPVFLRLKAAAAFQVKVAVTAQHRHMLDQVLDIFGIQPDFDLDIMSPDQDLFDITSRALIGLKEVLRRAAGLGPGPRRHHHHLCGGLGGLLPDNSRGTCGSGPPHPG
jgi:hypothetical protein